MLNSLKPQFPIWTIHSQIDLFVVVKIHSPFIILCKIFWIYCFAFLIYTLFLVDDSIIVSHDNSKTKLCHKNEGRFMLNYRNKELSIYRLITLRIVSEHQKENKDNSFQLLLSRKKLLKIFSENPTNFQSTYHYKTYPIPAHNGACT